MYVILRDIKINILQDAGLLKKFFPVSRTPLSHLDAEMDRGTAPIIRSASRWDSGVLEVLPGLDHLDSGKKPQGTILPYINMHFGHHSSCTSRIKLNLEYL